MVTPRRRPSWSRAAATWTCLWVSTPTVTRAGSRCAMVVLPSFLLRRVVGPAGRADNTATSLVATGSYQVTPLRSVLFASAVASSRQVLSQAPGRWAKGQTRATTARETNTVATAGRQVQSQASRRWRTGSDPTATTAGIIADAYPWAARPPPGSHRACEVLQAP